MGDLPNPGIKLQSPASPGLVGGFFTMELPGKPWNNVYHEGNVHGTWGQSISRINSLQCRNRRKQKTYPRR